MSSASKLLPPWNTTSSRSSISMTVSPTRVHDFASSGTILLVRSSYFTSVW